MGQNRIKEGQNDKKSIEDRSQNGQEDKIDKMLIMRRHQVKRNIRILKP